MSPDDNTPDFDEMSPKEVMNWMEKLAKKQNEVEPPGFQERKGDGMKLIELGEIAGLRLTAHWTALVGFVLLWAILSVVAIGLFYLSPLTGILGALAATLLHYFSEFFHQWGHARAAKRVGYPMIGVRYWWILGASIYPKDEPQLPGSVHIKRALGGPAESLKLTVIVGALAFIMIVLMPTDGGSTPFQEYLMILTAFLFLDNLFVFTLGAFVPLGFTDGSTILRWWGK